MRFWHQATQIRDYEREVDFLRRQLAFTEDRAIHAETKVELLEKTVISERSKHDKFVAVAMDKLTKNAGTFQKVMLPVPEVKPVEISEDELARIEWIAKMNKEADEDMGLTPQPLEYYIDIIKQDPQKYQPS